MREIVKEALKKIEYKEKYGVKFAPVKHKKYPMTTFRKRILE